MWSRSGSTGRISFMPTGSGGLSQSVIRKIAQPATNATTDATSTPMRAWSWRPGSSIAISTMKSEMVKPIPDSAAPPVTRRSVRPGASSPMPVRRMNHVAPVIPMNLPTTRPATMPHVNGDRDAAITAPASSRTPALTNANSGNTTNDTYGPISVCSRSLIEIDWRRRRVAARAYCEFGDCRNARITSTAPSTSCRAGAKTGINNATATPASVGWMPALKSAIHNATPSTA